MIQFFDTDTAGWK